jgi:predicted deacylase
MSRAHFSADLGEARAKFLAAAKSAGARIESFDNPARGPQGLALSSEVAVLGPADAAAVLVAVSGTHGVEGFAGSAAQIAWLRAAPPLPPGVGVLLVHALNPYGFAWLRRVNEDNVDINRNFIDHSKPHPENPIYDAVAEAMLPAAWNDAAVEALHTALQGLVLQHGQGADLKAGSGQYRHPRGLFYGGTEPVWSNRVLNVIARQYLAGVREVAYIDFHTGLGPFGHGEAICYHPPATPAFEAAARWYGSGLTSPYAGNAAAPVNSGKTGNGIMTQLPKALVSCVTLEFGTYAGARVLAAIAADGWLHTYGDLNTAKGQAIKAEIRAAFYPDQDDWKDLVASRSAEVLAQALAGLASG